jgi:hypothetical protein
MGMGTIRSKVVGVTFANSDGSNRQWIIRKFCRDGKPLDFHPEHRNPHSKNAIGLWVRGRWLLIFPARYQIGYISDDLAKGLREDIDDGCDISVCILDVTGGDWFRKPTYGVNIEIRLESQDSVTPGGHRTRATIRRGATDAPTENQPAPIPSSSPPGNTVAAVINSFGRMAVRAARWALGAFWVLPPFPRLIGLGAFGSLSGMALWLAGYLFNKTSGFFAVPRPAGVIALIIGAGIMSVGIVFSIAESSKESNN